MNRIKSSRIILENEIISGYVYFENGKITEVSDKNLPFRKEFDFGDMYVSPGFIDIHTHGGGGYAFDGSVEDVAKACDFHLSHGTTCIVPTISAAPIEYMSECAARIKKVRDEKLSGTNVVGCHMEGPYLSSAQCGAQVPDHIIPPCREDYERAVKELSDVIIRWTYAPENDADGVFCKYLADNNIIPSAGHTDAIYSDMLTAKENGMRLITHLYSCTSTVTRDHGFRRPGVIESAYLDDDMYVEIIADGKHLPPELIRLILKIKGTDRVILCTDSLNLAGTTAKSGVMQGTSYVIEDGVCKLTDRSAFAGSIATADTLVRVMVKEVGVSMPEAVKMLTKNPAALLKVNKGSLKPGYDADIVVFDDDVNIHKVFCGNRNDINS